MCRVCGCYRGGGIVVMDVFLASTLCKYDLRNVCIWRMFVFMSVVVTVWECLLCSGRC